LSRGVMDLIVELTESCGTSLLIVTHDLTMSLEFTDEIMVMYQGRLVERQAASSIAEHPAHPYTKGLLACIPTLDSVDTRRLPTLADFLAPAGADQ
jgi:ABC-type dipeptide/oligopeptide/nickel transport system ATPase component